jgi:thiol-disulfide isomerase/thioredoxin
MPQKSRKEKRNPKKIVKKTLKRKPKPVVFGHVYSTSCGHCINMQSEWDKVCQDLKRKHVLHDIGDNYESKISEFNQKYNTNLAYSGFPTIFRIRSVSRPVEYYNGERRKEPMKRWILNG